MLTIGEDSSRADPAFLPSQILLRSPIPLIGTMGRSEREAAAYLLVRTSQVRGDQWQYIPPRAIGEVMDSDRKAGIEPMVSLSINPFFFPDFHDLIDQQYAEYERRPSGYAYREGDPSMQFTTRGLRALRRWLRKPCPKCAAPSPCLWWTNEAGKLFGRSEGQVAGGWMVYQNFTPKIIDDDDFNITAAWKNCREIFICQNHGEFGLIDGGDPFFYSPDAYVLGPNGEKLFRL